MQKYRKIILITSLLFIIVGILTAYFNWSIEPHETIGGVLCGVGFSAGLIAFYQKNNSINER